MHSADPPILQAAAKLRSGGIVAMPTETVYGLAAKIDDENAIRKVFSVKERPFFDPLIVHIADLEQRKLVVSEWPEAAQLLAAQFWPGPLTLVLPKHPSISPLITSGLETVGIRQPRHPFARDLIRLAGSPLAAPSANKFGKTSPTTADHVRQSFANDDVFVLDGGQADVGLESTVLRITSDKLEILRPGAITKEMLEAALGQAGLSLAVTRAISNASPGHTEHHYMPDIPLVLFRFPRKPISAELRKKIALDLNLSSRLIGTELILDSRPAIAARELYAKLRICAEAGGSYIFCHLPEESSDSLWEAINDRMQRAASRVYTSD